MIEVAGSCIGVSAPARYCPVALAPTFLPVEIKANALLYGDNLGIMEQMKAGSVDLIYLDPPFNSQQSYNMVYSTLTGRPVAEQKIAFADTWSINEEQVAMLDEMPHLVEKYQIPSKYGDLWKTWLYALRDSDPKLLSYLLYMLRRLMQMRILLKETGSIYVHCDPTASHYLKVLMDGLFDHDNFRNEIIWERTTGRKAGRQYGRVHDTILFYSRGKNPTWNPPTVKQDESTVRGHDLMRDAVGLFRVSDLSGAGQGPARTFGERGEILPPPGRHWMFDQAGIDRLLSEGRITYSSKGQPRLKTYLADLPGVAVRDVWTDIEPLNSAAKDRLGYQTQKPVPLLKRIIEASSNPGDVVFDPFCGCGTTVYAAHETGRKWLGCDIAVLAVDIVSKALYSRYGLRPGEHFMVTGIPASLDAASALFRESPTEFQDWAVQAAGGHALTRKSGDRGIDGILLYSTKHGDRQMVLQVKGGKSITTRDIRDLRGVLERERNADLAGFITLNEPSKGMRTEAIEAGVFQHEGIDYPRIQILTIADILDGRQFKTPTRIGSKISKGQPSLPML